MKLHCKELLVRHGVEEPVHAVDDDKAKAVLIHHTADARNELSRREFCGINLVNFKLPTRKELGWVHPKMRSASDQRAEGLVESEDDCFLTSLRGRVGIAQSDRRLAAARRTNEQGTRPRIEATTEKLVEFRKATADCLPLEPRHVLGRNEAWVGSKAAGAYGVVVITLAEVRASELVHFEPAALDAEVAF